MGEPPERQFQPGQRVMTVDGLPGVIQETHDTSIGGTDDDVYDVRLDHGLGGGTYDSRQLTAMHTVATEVTAVGLHEAVEDYPEVGTLLRDHPDPAKLSFAAGRRTAVDESRQGLPRDTTQPDACAYCGGTDFENLTDNGRVRQATCSTCGGTMSAHPGAQWTAELVGDPSNHPKPTVDPASGANPGGGVPGVTDFLDFDSRIMAARDDRSHGKLPNDVSFHFAPSAGTAIPHVLEMHHEDRAIGDLHWDPNNGNISGVNVHPDYRRKGVASHLYTKAHDLARERREKGPEDTGWQTAAGHAFRSAFDEGERPDVSHIPTTVTMGPGEDDTDLHEHLIEHHFPSSAETVRQWSPEQAQEAHDNIATYQPCGWGKKKHEAAIDGPDWCTWRREARCTFPGDATAVSLAIPQDRGPCPWDTRWAQQVCPIAEPSPMALMQRKGSVALPDRVDSSETHIAALEAKMAADEDHETWYHITDHHDFKLNPHFAPENNTTWGGNAPQGLFVSKHPEVWSDKHGYVRPWLAEIRVPKHVLEHPDVRGGYSGERHIPGHLVDHLKVNRVMPIDAHTRENFGVAGRIEEHHGDAFDTGEKFSEPVPMSLSKTKSYGTGYRYPGPDARDMDSQTVHKHRDRWKRYMIENGVYGPEDFEDEPRQHQAHRFVED